MKGCLYVNECCYRHLISTHYSAASLNQQKHRDIFSRTLKCNSCFHIFAIFYNIDYFLRRMIVWELPHEISINIEKNSSIYFSDKLFWPFLFITDYFTLHAIIQGSKVFSSGGPTRALQHAASLPYVGINIYWSEGPKVFWWPWDEKLRPEDQEPTNFHPQGEDFHIKWMEMLITNFEKNPKR